MTIKAWTGSSSRTGHFCLPQGRLLNQQQKDSLIAISRIERSRSKSDPLRLQTARACQFSPGLHFPIRYCAGATRLDFDEAYTRRRDGEDIALFRI